MNDRDPKKNKCRACFGNNAELDWHSLLYIHSHLTYKDCYYKYTQMEFVDEDNFSTMLCINCSKALEYIDAFVSKAIEAHKKLQMLELNVIKDASDVQTILLEEIDIKPEVQNMREDTCEEFIDISSNMRETCGNLNEINWKKRKPREMSSYNKFFKVIKSINKTVCLECEKHLSGINVSNIKRHYKLIHKKNISEEAMKYESDDGSIYVKNRKIEDFVRIDVDKNQFLKCCVGLVAVRNLPFTYFDDSEFFKILIRPYEKKFDTNFNSKNIADVVESSCAQIQQIIIKRVRNRMISLKFDIATRMDKSIIGINIQYIKDFKIYVNTLGIIRLQKRHNTSCLKEKILTCLKTYQIDIGQIYSYTTDTGANILEVSQTLQEDRFEEVKIEENSISSEDNEDSIHKILAPDITVVRCAAHTIQLAVNDVLRDFAQQINKCRDAVKQLQTTITSGDPYIQMQVPTMDNTKQWSSTYEMFVSLLEASHHIKLFYIEKSNIPGINWKFVTNFVAAFKPLTLFIKQLKKEQYVMGDFYRDWLCCEIELEELFPVTPYASLLHNCMQIRKKLLFKNDAFLAALYLDPRFNFENSTFLSEQQRTAAIEHLVKSFDIVISIENVRQRDQSESDSLSSSSDIQTEFPSTSAFSKLEQRIMESITKTRATSHHTFKQRLMLLATKKKLPLDTDVLNYWKRTGDSEIKKIVEVALAVPATQVSVERAFSALPVVFTKSGSKLNCKTLTNLLITKLNFKELNTQNISVDFNKR